VDPGFQVRGGALKKKLHRVQGGTKIFGVFCVKNHDFMQKNHIFSNFRGGGVRPCSQRHSVINHCDRLITLLSDTDISFGLFNLFTYFDMPFG
jgi:hypothetical protein